MNRLPVSVKEFFQFANAQNLHGFTALFAEDACVLDEKKERKGIEAIKEWSENSIFSLNVTFKVKHYTVQGDKIIVTAEVDGDFNKTGLPSDLCIDHCFNLKSGKIAELHCSENKDANR